MSIRGMISTCFVLAAAVAAPTDVGDNMIVSAPDSFTPPPISPDITTFLDLTKVDDITTETVVTTLPDLTRTDDPSDNEVVSRSGSEEANATVEVLPKFPHAVLFGGTCGGSIISPTWILTAAHCTISSYNGVLAGTGMNDGSGVYRVVKRHVMHPKFTVGPYWVDAQDFGLKQVGARFDYLLVELKELLPLDGVTMAAIPLDEERSHPADVEVGFAGYGAARFGDSMRDTMHEMQLRTLADETCEEKFLEYNREDMICTKGYPPRLDSACAGDSGSGLVGSGKLIGVTSWVEEDAVTCRPGTVVVFARVAAARDWIREVTGI